jgi:hypothetical protein
MDSATEVRVQIPGSAQRECTICYEGQPDHVLLPCGHGTFCEHCIKAMHSETAPHKEEKPFLCPVCRAPVEEVAKVHLDTMIGQWSAIEWVATV